ncbi:Aspartate/glutamate/uridylate kinase [Globomyces pollinis-pini]|nr:Aspartate/glutamate/uridylate kinase [Globomyces pollinis-pini]
MKTIVIKLGTSSICDELSFIPKLSNLSSLIETVVHLNTKKFNIIIVSSGAVAVGLKTLNLKKRPKQLQKLQAVAAVGQGRLMALYDTLFSQFNLPIAQILLSRDNVSDRIPYLNAKNTLKELLTMNVVPIINENDSVSTNELRFGDNDSLSAIVAGMVHADFLFLLTDVDGLYTDNPRLNPLATPIKVVHDIQALREQVNVQSSGSSVGTGGMVTKLIAAELSTAAGCSMIITRGSVPTRIIDILNHIEEFPDVLELPFGTRFVAASTPMDNKLWWIRHSIATSGSLTIDAGAYKAITRKQRGSLFAAGITTVTGTFNANQSVIIQTVLNNTLTEIARGIVSYSAVEINLIKGLKSRDIKDVLGYVECDYVIHRDHLAIDAAFSNES